jgi:predicted ester cyclase
MNLKMVVMTGSVAGVLLLCGVSSAKSEGNREVIDRWFAIVDSRQTEKLASVETADFVMKMPMGTIKGVEGHTGLVKMFGTAFPNMKHTVTRCVESGETISCEGTFAGDNTGPMAMPNGKSLPASGKHVDFGWAGIATVKGGKVASVNVYFDTMALMQQIGAVPPQ